MSDDIIRQIDSICRKLERMENDMAIVVRIEERHTAMNERLAVLVDEFREETKRRAAIDDSVFSRVRKLETQTEILRDRRVLIDSFAVPLAVALFSALATWTVMNIWGG